MLRHFRMHLVLVSSLGLMGAIFGAAQSQASTLDDLKSQLDSLKAKAIELQMTCDLGTRQGDADDVAVAKVRQNLAVDLSKHYPTSLAEDLSNLNTLVASQISDKSHSIDACASVKFNMVEVDKVNKRLFLVNQLSVVANATEAAYAAAEAGNLIFLAGCDASPTAASNVFIQILSSTNQWISVPTNTNTFYNPDACQGSSNKYGFWIIENLAPGTIYRLVYPNFGSVTENRTIPDYFSKYVDQSATISSQAVEEKNNFANVIQTSLFADISAVANAFNGDILTLTEKVRIQKAKYPQQSGAYQKLIEMIPRTPLLNSDVNSDVITVNAFLNAFSNTQAQISKLLGGLIPKPTSIFCTKGKLFKKISGLKPICPKGYSLNK